MSRKRIRLLKGKIYHLYTVGGPHPSLIFKKNKKKNRYYAIVFDTSSGRHRTKLKYTTEPHIKQSFVQNRPVLGVRRDFGNRELVNIKINREDKIIIKIVSKRKPRLTSEYKKSHKE